MAVKTSGKNLKQLREEKATLATQIQSHVSDNEESWSDEHEAKHTEMMSDHSDLAATIQRREEAEKCISNGTLSLESKEEFGSLSQNAPNLQIQVRGYERDSSGRGVYAKVDVGGRGGADYQSSFESYLRGGAGSLSVEQQAQLQSDDDEAAGYLVTSEQFASHLLREVDDLLFIRRYAKVHTVREASSLGIRNRSKRLSSAAWGSELSSPLMDSSMKFGKKVLTPHYITQGIATSRDLIRRAVQPIEQIIREELARDAAELQEDGFFYGHGSEQPLGLFTASDEGIGTDRDVVAGSSTEITADGLLDVKYSLKSQYRNGGEGAIRWLFHRNGVKQIAKLKTSDGQFIWQPGLQAGEPDRLLNYPIDESERAPNTYTTGKYVGLLANYSFYEIADALDMDMQILNGSPYAEKNLIAYINRMKTDGMPTHSEAFVRAKLG